MHRTKDQIDAGIKECMCDLENIALRDKVISEEEALLLTKIRNEFSNLHDQLIQVLESNLSESDFNELLIDMLNDIVDNTMKVAMADNNISDDERALIVRLQDFVQKGANN